MTYTKELCLRMARRSLGDARESVRRWNRRDAAFHLNLAAKFRRMWTHDRFKTWENGVGKR